MNWITLVLISAVTLSFYTLLLKHTLSHEKNTQIIALYPLVPVVLLALFADIDYGAILTHVGWLLFLKAAAISLTIYSASLALERMPVSLYAPMRNLSPLFLLVLSWALLSEHVSIIQILGLLLIIGGAIFLDIDVREKHQLRQLKRFFGKKETFLLLLASFIGSFAPLFDRLILYETTPVTNLFYYLAIMSIIFWAIHIFKERRLPFQGLLPWEASLISVMGLVILVSDLLYFYAVTIPGTLIVVIIGTRRISNFFATLWGGKLFHEEHILYKGAMCLVMIAGTILLLL